MKTKRLSVLLVAAVVFVGCSKDKDVTPNVSPNSLKGTAIINGATSYQTIDGFGFSSAWCGTLSSAKNNALYNTLGMSLLRVRIDQSNNWSEETANAAAAHSHGVKVLGTPWSPPVQWKSNGSSTGGYLLSQYYGNYASWLNQAANSIGLDYVSIQNEPDISGSTSWSASQFLTFVKNNASAIGRPVVMPESYHFNDALSDPVLNDGSAVNRISVVAGHIYGGGNYVHQNAINHGKHVWMTEHYINGQNSISACMSIAKEISDCMNNQMSAYFWWWVNDGDNNVNLVNSNGTIYKNGYTIGQFAKWVRPGKVRIATTYNPTSGVYVTAYRNGGLVIVAVNTTSSYVWQTFTLQNISGVSSLQVNRTTSSLNMSYVGTATVSNNTFGLYMPPQSISTCHQF